MPLLWSELKRNILKLGSGRDSSPESPDVLFRIKSSWFRPRTVCSSNKKKQPRYLKFEFGGSIDSNETRVTKANQLFYRFYWNGFRAAEMETKHVNEGQFLYCHSTSDF